MGNRITSAESLLQHVQLKAVTQRVFLYTERSEVLNNTLQRVPIIRIVYVNAKIPYINPARWNMKFICTPGSIFMTAAMKYEVVTYKWMNWLFYTFVHICTDPTNIDPCKSILLAKSNESLCVRYGEQINIPIDIFCIKIIVSRLIYKFFPKQYYSKLK